MTSPLPDLVLIEERRNPFTTALELHTRFGVVTHIQPGRDLRVPAQDLPEVMDPARPAFGYTGRLLHADQAPVILLDQRMRQQITEWQRVWHEPFPAFGMRQAIRGDALTIEATNGAWIWRLLPAYWPQMSGHHNGDRGWWVGVWQS
jgi:hypothetical protein